MFSNELCSEVDLADQLLTRQHAFIGLIISGTPVKTACLCQPGNLLLLFGMTLQVFVKVKHVLHREMDIVSLLHSHKCRRYAGVITSLNSLLGCVKPGNIVMAGANQMDGSASEISPISQASKQMNRRLSEQALFFANPVQQLHLHAVCRYRQPQKVGIRRQFQRFGIIYLQV